MKVPNPANRMTIGAYLKTQFYSIVRSNKVVARPELAISVQILRVPIATERHREDSDEGQGQC
jgi:hypothetical protein